MKVISLQSYYVNLLLQSLLCNLAGLFVPERLSDLYLLVFLLFHFLTAILCVLSFQSVSSPLQSLQQRTWLIHWSLFVFFNHPKGRDNIIELFLYQPQWVSLSCNIMKNVHPFFFFFRYNRHIHRLPGTVILSLRYILYLARGHMAEGHTGSFPAENLWPLLRPH